MNVRVRMLAQFGRIVGNTDVQKTAATRRLYLVNKSVFMPPRFELSGNPTNAWLMYPVENIALNTNKMYCLF